MNDETGRGSEQVKAPSFKDVLVPNVDAELYQQFCERTKALGVEPESVLAEVVNRGMSEWLRMRSG